MTLRRRARLEKCDSCGRHIRLSDAVDAAGDIYYDHAPAQLICSVGPSPSLESRESPYHFCSPVCFWSWANDNAQLTLEDMQKAGML